MNKLYLYIVLAATLIAGIGIRLSHVGWIFVFLGIPLLLVAILHCVIQFFAIHKPSDMKSSYKSLILLSNLFFLLGFALQSDFGDLPGDSFPSDGNLWNLYFLASIAFLIALIISWIFLVIRGELFQKNKIQEDFPIQAENEPNIKNILLMFLSLALISIITIVTWGYTPLGIIRQPDTPISIKVYLPREELYECTHPILDGRDRLDTTGCGKLEAGSVVTGTIDSASEAHNWQFYAQQNSRIKVIDQPGECPVINRIKILNYQGNIIKWVNASNLGDCNRASINFFDPPYTGMYILRISRTETPGTYWLKIEEVD